VTVSAFVALPTMIVDPTAIGLNGVPPRVIAIGVEMEMVEAPVVEFPTRT
jgi:hypothetical protein